MNVAVTNSKRFQSVVEAAARQLAAVSHVGGSSFISTPLLYPDGSTVVVRVDQAGTELFVSDFGAGFNEAELMGGGLIYRKAAASIAETAGIGFDQMSFFVLHATEAQLAGAVATVANCSQEAVSFTALRLAERRTRDQDEALYERLISVFAKRNVIRDAPVVGASNTEWHVASLVNAGRKQVAFEAVTKSPNSVVFAATKFADLSRLEHPPIRVSVVKRKAELGTYLGVLSQASTVIEERATDDVIRSLVNLAA